LQAIGGRWLASRWLAYAQSMGGGLCGLEPTTTAQCFVNQKSVYHSAPLVFDRISMVAWLVRILVRKYL
jgi:hypothetical protein